MSTCVLHLLIFNFLELSNCVASSSHSTSAVVVNQSFRLFFYDSVCGAIRLLSSKYIFQASGLPDEWRAFLHSNITDAFVADVHGPCVIFLTYFFLFKLLTRLGTWFLSSFALTCNLFIGAFWSCVFCLCSDRTFSQGNALRQFRQGKPFISYDFCPLVFTCF